MNPQKGMVVDHINHDGLDNRRENLRVCTQEENNRNKRSLSSKSGLKGVVPVSRPGTKPWRAFIQGRLIGYFLTKQEAAKAYNKKAKKLFGEFAHLNQT